MLFLAFALAATSPDGIQVLAGPSFEKFAEMADRQCPSRHLRNITPGDLDWLQETFEEQLSPAQRRRLSSLNHANNRCSKLNGLSCPTVENLGAMDRVGMLRGFSSFACEHHTPKVVR